MWARKATASSLRCSFCHKPKEQVEQVLAGGNRQLQELAAAGLLPLAPEQLIPLQVTFARSRDAGERKVLPGDWIIEGENHECYVVDNAFFQRTFVPIPWDPPNEGRHYGA